MFERIFSALGSAIGGIYSTPVRSNRRPTGAALRNPADPIQAARIEAAAIKRARRADKLQRDALESRNSNRAHIATRLDKIRMLKSYDLPNRFNPFYVAK